MAYPLYTYIERLADSLNAKAPREGYFKTIEKIFLDDMKLTDAQMDRVFALAIDEERFPTVGRMRQLAERVTLGTAKTNRIVHVSFRCTKCHYVYAVPVARMQDAGEFDVIHCEGMRRIAPNAMPKREQKYEHEKCNQSYTVAYIATLWRAQGTGQSVDLV